MAASHSLRRRAAFAIALLTIAVVGAHSVALFSVADDQEDDLMDQIVVEELDHLIDQYHNDPTVAPPHGQFLTAYIVRDTAGRTGLPAYLRDLPAGMHEMIVGDIDLHVGVRTEGEVRFYVAYDVTHNEEGVREFGWLLVLGVALTAVVASVLGYWVAGLVVQPVTHLAERVGQLGPGPSSRPLAADYAEAEVAKLAHAFDGYAAKVAELVEREQEFTANVSHELRTPLTSIATGCELLLQEPGLADDTRRRIESIRRAGARMSDIVRALLFLARGERTAPETIALRECAEEAAEHLQPLLSGKPVALEINIAPEAVVRADHTAMLLVLGNLLRNAIEHTERGYVRVQLRSNVLTVEDSGHGIAPQDLSRVFQRHYRGSTPSQHIGTGLGLAIVKHICDRYGWSVTLESSPDAGTRVQVRLGTL